MPAANSAFPISLGKNLWALGVYYFNLYLVKGAHATALIEVGVSGMVDRAIGQLDRLGVAPDFLVVTHPHTDHLTGLNGLLTRYPSARVVAGQGARAFAQHPKAVQNMIREDRFISERLSMLGLPPGRGPINELCFPRDYLAVRKNLEIDLGGGVQLHCRTVAGHSPGQIAVHIPVLSALAPSDAMGFHFPGRGILPIFLTDYRAYIQTLDALAALEANILCLAHQGPLAGSAATQAFFTARRSAEELLARIAAFQEDDAGLVETLFRENYRDEFAIYSEENIRSVAHLLVRRAREYLRSAGHPERL